MKFSEKLVNLRKQNKMSQEQLASMLDVSRQAVSKWESGTTYPEMDKLITMCKIFKCSLDDLTNDEISNISFEEKKKGNIIFDILDMVVKTLDMVKCMNFKQIIGFLFSMGLLLIILIFLKLPIDYIINLGNHVIMHFNFLPNSLLYIWQFLVTIAYLAICFVTIIYVFKSMYLDKFEYTVNNNIIKKDMNKSLDSDEETHLNYIIKNDNKVNSFFKFFGSIAMLLLKLTIILVLIPFIFTFFCLFALLVITIILLFRRVIYIGIILGILFCILLNYVVLELGYDFIFNKKIAMKRVFIMLIIAISGAGISMGIFAYEFSLTQFIDESPIKNESEIVKVYDMNDQLYIYDLYYNEADYIIDENLKDKVEFKVIYNDKYRNIDIKNYDDGIGIYILNDSISLYSKEIVDLIIKDLANKKIHNYNYIYDYKIIIKSSSKNINKIKENNRNKLIEEEKRSEDEMTNQYLQQIDNYQNENTLLSNKIENLNEKISSLTETNKELQEEINSLKEKIKEYKDNLSNLLDE